MWDKSEIPSELFTRRVDDARQVLKERGLDALLVYSDLARSDQARFFSNLMLYFNRALLIIPRESELTLLCGLSPRVYGWIRSVTTIEDIRPAGNFARPLFELVKERSWSRLGALDLDQFPYDIHKDIRAGSVEIFVDILNVETTAVFRPDVDETELAMRRKASTMVEEILADEMPNAVGIVDHQFVGRLERRFRRAGAEDLIVLVSNGDTVPAPPTGATLGEDFLACVAMEFRGHWVQLTRFSA
jgi:Xaa-Pro aminopeptidase